jgi:hypothetical protein
MNNNVLLMEVLLMAGGSPNLTHGSGETLAMDAAGRNVAMLRVLETYGADLSTVMTGGLGTNALGVAIRMGKLDCVKFLVEEGVTLVNNAGVLLVPIAVRHLDKDQFMATVVKLLGPSQAPVLATDIHMRCYAYQFMHQTLAVLHGYGIRVPAYYGDDKDSLIGVALRAYDNEYGNGRVVLQEAPERVIKTISMLKACGVAMSHTHKHVRGVYPFELDGLINSCYA